MTNLEMNRNIADFIGLYCTRWNISASKFAEKCGIPYMTIKRILACNVQKIDVYTVSRIAQATRTPMMEILNIKTENPELYRRIFHASPRDREILSSLMDVLDRLHISGRESREIPCLNLGYDRISYLLGPQLFVSDRINFHDTEKVVFRSCFTPGLDYYGFRLPNNELYPRYPKGTILLAANEDPKDGDFCAFIWKDQGYVRLVFRVLREHSHYAELLPINHLGRKYRINYDNITDQMTWIPVGVIAGVVML